MTEASQDDIKHEPQPADTTSETSPTDITPETLPEPVHSVGHGSSAISQPGSNTEEKEENGVFDPGILDKSVIARPLYLKMKEDRGPQSVIIEPNLKYSGGHEAAKKQVEELVEQALKKATAGPKGQGPCAGQGTIGCRTKLAAFCAGGSVRIAQV